MEEQKRDSMVLVKPEPDCTNVFFLVIAKNYRKVDSRNDPIDSKWSDTFCGNEVVQMFTLDRLYTPTESMEQYRILENDDAINFQNSICNGAPGRIYPSLDKDLVRVLCFHFFIVVNNNKYELCITYFEIRRNIFDYYMDSKLINSIIKDEKNIKKQSDMFSYFENLSNYHSLYERAIIGAHKLSSGEDDVKIHIESLIVKLQSDLDSGGTQFSDPMISQPTFLKKGLHLHGYQLKNLYWLLDSEKQSLVLTHEKKVLYQIGTKYTAKENKIVETYSDKIERSKVLGRILCDQVGLGKTIQSIVLTFLNYPVPGTPESQYIQNGENLLCSNATLIIVPEHLSAQWENEYYKFIDIEKCTEILSETPKIIMMTRYNQYEKLTYNDLLDAHIVITTRTFLQSDNFIASIYRELTNMKSQSNIFSNFDGYNGVEVKTKIAEKSLEFLNTVKNSFHLYETKPASRQNFINPLDKTCPNLLFIKWFRLEVDEFHTYFQVNDSESKDKTDSNRHENSRGKWYTSFNIISQLQSRYRHAVTATPFTEKSTSMCYLYKFIISDPSTKIETNYAKIFTNADTQKFIKYHMFRRNTTATQNQYLGIPRPKFIKLEISLSPIEWQIYNSIIADPNLDKYSIKVLQMLCNLMLYKEFKNAFDGCKSIEEISENMAKVNNNAVRIATNEYNIALTRYNYMRTICMMEQMIKCKNILSNHFNITLHLSNYNTLKNLTETYAHIVKMENGQDLVYGCDTQTKFLGLKDPHPRSKKRSITVDDKYFFNNPATVLPEGSKYTHEIESKEGIINVEHFHLRILLNEMKESDRKEIEPKLENMFNTELYSQKNNLKRAHTVLCEKRDILTGKKATQQKFESMVKMINIIKQLKHRKTQTISLSACRRNIDDSSSDEDSDNEKDDDNSDELMKCNICKGQIDPINIGLTTCGHVFCYNDLKINVNTKGNCPTCNTRITMKDIVKIENRREDDKTFEAEQYRFKNTLIEKYGSKITNLICILHNIQKQNNAKCIIFSQWEKMLEKVGESLTENGFINKFCAGTDYEKLQVLRDFQSNPKFNIMMMSSSSAAEGTNLTAASYIILIEPARGSVELRRNIESQAIGRAVRQGQDKVVTIIRLIMAGTVEDDIYNESRQADRLHVKAEDILTIDTSVQESSQYIITDSELEEKKRIYIQNFGSSKLIS